MLSNDPTANLRQQRQHRRTQSTATPYPTTEVPALPNVQALSAHRRGISLDNRRPTSAHEPYRVSNTNIGFTDNQQHALRETQQQRLARQGQPSPFYYNPPNDESYLMSPIVTPQRQSFDGGSLLDIYGAPMQNQQYQQFSNGINLTRPVTADGNMNINQYANQDSSFYQPESGAITPSAYIDFSQALDGLNDDWGATIKPVSRPVSRPLSRNFATRVPQFDALSGGPSSTRQLTPPTVNSSSYFPSPAHTPYNGTVKMEGGTLPRRFQEDYDMSMEETIKPSRRSSPAKSNFQQMREQAELDATADRAKMPPSAYFAPPSRPTSQLSNYESPYHSESDTRSQQNSPQLYKKQLYHDPFSNKPSFASGSEHSRDSSPDYSNRQRTLSISSELNPDEAIHETGISIDDIAQFISGPDPTDQKYLCLYPSCEKRFGRKENIKSHVQTHLGDRQFQCPHCSKCFVRQHDLKRHAKIHSGVKPYPCKCGNSFARHDALTRHRQRGMCVGAFEGVVKKVVKRGRPRKQRPDDEDRTEKSSRTRSRVKKERSNTMTSETSCSDASEYSRSSYSMSPAPQVHDYGVAAASPFQSAAFPDSAPFPDFVTTNPFRQQSQAELDRISRNIFGDDQPAEFKYNIGGHLQVPRAGSSQSNCVSPQATMNTGSGGSVVSNTSPPGLTESFHSGSSPGENVNFYEGQSLQVDADAMFLDFENDAGVSLAQEADLLTLDSGLNLEGGKGYEGFGVDVDVDPADISLFSTEEGNSWLI